MQVTQHQTVDKCPTLRDLAPSDVVVCLVSDRTFFSTASSNYPMSGPGFLALINMLVKFNVNPCERVRYTRGETVPYMVTSQKGAVARIIPNPLWMAHDQSSSVLCCCCLTRSAAHTLCSFFLLMLRHPELVH